MLVSLSCLTKEVVSDSSSLLQTGWDLGSSVLTRTRICSGSWEDRDQQPKGRGSPFVSSLSEAELLTRASESKGEALTSTKASLSPVASNNTAQRLRDGKGLG